MSLDATVGGASSNSYQDAEEATTYFSDRPEAADWVALGDAQNSWLIAACERMEQLTFLGVRVTETQALSFPREGLVVDGVELSYSTIPSKVMKAQAKYALLLSEESDILADTGLEGFERLKVDVIELVPRMSEAAGELPEEIKRELAPFLSSTSTFQFRVARG